MSDEPRDQSVVQPQLLTRDRLLARNFVINLLGQVLPIIVAVVAIPPLIAALGPERFGLLSLAWVLIGYFSLFDFGLGRALTQVLAEQIGSGQEQESPVYIWTALVLMLGFGLVGSALVVAGAVALVDQVLNLDPGLRDEVHGALYLLAMAIPMVIVTSGLQGVLTALQRFDLINLVRTPLGLFNYLGPLVVLPFAATVPAVVAVLVIGRIVATVAYSGFCLQVYPRLRQQAGVRLALVPSLLGLGGWMTVTNIVGPVMMYMDRFLIGALAVVSAVAYYTTPYEIVSRLLLIPVALISVLFPAFTTSFFQSPARTAQIFERSVKYIFLIMFPLLFGLTALSHESLQIWLGPEFAARSTLVLQLLAAGFFLNSLAQAPFALIQGLGRPALTARLHLFELPFYLVALWALVSHYGIEGAAVAWLLRGAIDMLLLFVIARRLLPPQGRFYPWLGLGLAGAGLAFALCILVASLELRLLAVLLVLGAFCAIAWLYVFSGEERAIVMSQLRRLTPLAGRL